MEMRRETLQLRCADRVGHLDWLQAGSATRLSSIRGGSLGSSAPLCFTV